MTKEAKRKREHIGLTEKSKTVDINPAILILNINELNSKRQKSPVWISKENTLTGCLSYIKSAEHRLKLNR